MAVSVAPDGANKNFTINCSGGTTYSIAGSAGAPSVTVTATGGLSTTSNAAGSYTLSSLPAGSYTVTPSKPGCSFTPPSRQVTVGPSSTGQSFTASCGSWSGPTVTVVSDSERKKVRICAQAGGCTEGVPLFLALNTETSDINVGNWTDFDYQLAAMDSHLTGVPGAVPILEVNLASIQPPFLQQLISHLNAVAHPPYLLLRWFIRAPSSEPLLGQHMAGSTDLQILPDINATWLSAAKTEVENVLNYVDQNYSGKVASLAPVRLHRGQDQRAPAA